MVQSPTALRWGRDDIDITVASTIDGSTVFGGDGDDNIASGNTDTTLTDATLRGDGGDDTIDLQLDGGSKSLINGNKGDDEISLDQGTAADTDMTVSGGDGNDTIDFDYATLAGSDFEVNGNGGDDVIDIDAGTNDTAFTIKAGAGDDTIDMSGAATENANTVVVLSEGDDVITGAGTLATLLLDDDALVGDDDAINLPPLPSKPWQMVLPSHSVANSTPSMLLRSPETWISLVVLAFKLDCGTGDDTLMVVQATTAWRVAQVTTGSSKARGFHHLGNHRCGNGGAIASNDTLTIADANAGDLTSLSTSCWSWWRQDRYRLGYRSGDCYR